MATTASNAPAPFGVLPTPSYPPQTPYLTTDVRVKTELDPNASAPAAFHSSPAHGVPLEGHESETVNQPDDFAPAPVPSQSSVDEMMASLRTRSESVSMAHQDDPDLYSEAVSQMAESVKAELASYAAEEPAAVEAQPMQAYAKLQFDDGDFYVNTYAVELGRDQEAMRRERKHMKRSKRREERLRELNTNENEESEPREQRRAQPAISKGISGSNVSESGGIIGVSVYSESEDEVRHVRRRRRKAMTSQDSSHSQSIAPAEVLRNPHSLALPDDFFTDDGQSFAAPPMDIPFIPIFRPSDTTVNGVSRKHVRIEYSSEKAYWQLHVLGRNGAFVDGQHYGKGETARLKHNSHIQIQMMNVTFKLPDCARDEEAQLLSHLSGSGGGSPLSVAESDKEDNNISSSDLEEEKPKDRPRLKLSLSRRGQNPETQPQKSAKISLKPPKNKDMGKSHGASDEDADNHVKEEVRQSIEDVPLDTKAKSDSTGVPAVPAANLPPGSVLEGLAPEEIPQKRKGPGRPPKNGVMSKRDEAIIKRKKKELQKAGLEVPPLAELLAMARAESGTTMKKPGGEDDEAAAIGGHGASSESLGPNGESLGRTQNAAELEAVKARKAAAKSPSPQKPESEYTEEELKKPQKTYVVLIHDALSASTTGIMDLQQIYDAIQKMYPYYKYRSQTQGWQSSIRHNLIGSEAFEEAGKIGKGRLWKINPAFPIDKEKKRRAPTPPPAENKPSYPYPYPAGQYGNQGYSPYRPSPYGTPYGPPTTNLPNGARPPPSYGQQRNGTYYSPYAANPPTGQPPPPPPPPSQQQHQNAHQRPPPHNAAPGAPPNAHPNVQQANTPRPISTTSASTRSPSAGTVPGGVQGKPPQQEAIGNNDTIEEIMAYHKRYLGQFKPGPEQDAARDLFRKAVSRHIDQNKVHGAYISDEEKKVADVIGEIIARNRNKSRPAAPPPQPQPASVAGQGTPAAPTAPQTASLPAGQRTMPPPPQHQSNLTPAPAAATALPHAPGAPPPPAPFHPTSPTSPAPRRSSVTIDLTGDQTAVASEPRPVAPTVPAPAAPSAAATSGQAEKGSLPHATNSASESVATAAGVKRPADDEGERSDAKRGKAQEG